MKARWQRSRIRNTCIFIDMEFAFVFFLFSFCKEHDSSSVCRVSMHSTTQHIHRLYTSNSVFYLLLLYVSILQMATFTDWIWLSRSAAALALKHMVFCAENPRFPKFTSVVHRSALAYYYFLFFFFASFFSENSHTNRRWAAAHVKIPHTKKKWNHKLWVRHP